MSMPTGTSPKTFVCEVCSAVLGSQRDLDNHLCLLHDDCENARLGGPITFRCAACGAAFARRGDLFVHQREYGHGRSGDGDAGPGGRRPTGRSRRRAA
jgi:hypothetical protein